MAYDNIEDAMKAVVSRAEAKREIEKHSGSWAEFARAHGDKPTCRGSTVLRWLGY